MENKHQSTRTPIIVLTPPELSEKHIKKNTLFEKQQPL